MKIDISGFFMSLPKQSLYDCIRRFLTPRYPARDLPMLLYLDELDWLVTGEWCVLHCGRYVDDMVLIHPSKRHLLEVKAKIGVWLSAHGLTLHPRKTHVQHYGKGVLSVGLSSCIILEIKRHNVIFFRKGCISRCYA